MGLFCLASARRPWGSQVVLSHFPAMDLLGSDTNLWALSSQGVTHVHNHKMSRFMGFMDLIVRPQVRGIKTKVSCRTFGVERVHLGLDAAVTSSSLWLSPGWGQESPRLSGRLAQATFHVPFSPDVGFLLFFFQIWSSLGTPRISIKDFQIPSINVNFKWKRKAGFLRMT